MWRSVRGRTDRRTVGRSEIAGLGGEVASRAAHVIAPGNVWVFGGALAGIDQPIGTWHLSGSHWTHFNTGEQVLFGASVVLPSDIWASGADFVRGPAMAHWNGRSWRELTSIDSVLPKHSAGLGAVKAMSANDVLVLAGVFKKRTESFIVAHWNGRKWNRVKPGSPSYYLPAAVSDGHGGWWSAPYAPDNAPAVRYLLHRVGGRWVKVSLPVPVEGAVITNVPHTRAMMVAGTQIEAHGSQGVVLAFGRL